ncbi:MAG: sarcosine oxidase subunit delta [Gammaproteobacteria bacterium]|nr:sarcosine oxidase subunit delta [Gammaproteobacteria bacterium]
MRLDCPLCGPREHGEFTYLGDARLTDRPDPAAADAAARFHDYVHLRDNPAGEHRELWYHDAGCRSWLVVTRNTRTHAISHIVRAQDEGAR